jgi:Tol biopolymer transport system component
MSIVKGTSGNNSLSGSSGMDLMIGGAGDDTYIVNHINDIVREYDVVVGSLGKTTLLTVNSQGYAHSGFDTTISPLGDKIIFESGAALINSDTNQKWDIFTQDLESGKIQRVNTSSEGRQSNGPSYDGSISPDGSKVVFSSDATNLVKGDANREEDVFVKDLMTAETIRISTDKHGLEANNYSQDASFSPDGTKVIFESHASNLVEGDTNRIKDIFVKDLITGDITRVNTFSDGVGIGGWPNNWGGYDGGSNNASFSPDGQKVIFDSIMYYRVVNEAGTDIDIFGAYETFIKDLKTGELIVIGDSNQGQLPTSYSHAGFSADGEKILLIESSYNQDKSSVIQKIYVKDITTGEKILVNAASTGNLGNGFSSDPAFSPDGTKVVFTSSSTNLVKGDTNDLSDIFIKDLITGEIARVSTDSIGKQTEGWGLAPDSLFWHGHSSGASFSPDGSQIIFTSEASSLVDNDGNITDDAFSKDLIKSDSGGKDTIKTFISYILPDFVENMLLMGNELINATGNSLNNTLTGNSANNKLDGGKGGDTLIGGKGDDTYYVDNAKDKVLESIDEGQDKVISSVSYSLVGAHVESLVLTGSLNINATPLKIFRILDYITFNLHCLFYIYFLQKKAS